MMSHFHNKWMERLVLGPVNPYTILAQAVETLTRHSQISSAPKHRMSDITGSRQSDDA